MLKDFMLILGGAGLHAAIAALINLLRSVPERDDQTDNIMYGFQVNGELRYEPELPPASERDAGPYMIYYGYRVSDYE